MPATLALRDRRRLPGELLVQSNARALATFRVLERDTFRLLGGWMAETPEWDVKLATGKHVWEGAQQAQRLGRRLVELRAPARGTRVPRVAVELIAACDQSRDTLERLVAIYRVVKPFLATASAELANRTSAVADAPTVDLLNQWVPQVERHIRWGESWIGELASTAESRERAVRWQLELEGHVQRIREALSGDVPRSELVDADPPPLEPRWVEGQPYEPPVKNAARDERFVPLMNVRPEDPNIDPKTELLSRFHRMSQSELGAAELLGRVMYEHPEMPFDFHYDMARQTWDEVRHCEVAWKRLEDLGGHLGMFPEKHGGNYERRMSMDLPHLLAILGPVEEAAGNVRFKEYVREGLDRDDFDTALLYDYVLADETTHVRFQTRWLSWLAHHDAAKQRRWIDEAKAMSDTWNTRRRAEADEHDRRVLAGFGIVLDSDTMDRQSRAMEFRPTAD
jgi:uncharacterized ferritin-like protein (DUF455 family)